MSYCLLADLKNYLNITATTDDALLQRLLDGASARIDSRTGKTFQAAADSTRYVAPGEYYNGRWLLDAPLSHITTVTNGDLTDVTADVITCPRNETPWYAIRGKTSVSWVNTDDEPLTITGRWAWLDRYAVTSITRASNTVTATVSAPGLSVYHPVYAVGFANTSFDGAFTLTAVTSTTVSWAQSGTNASSTTGVLLAPPVDIVTACRRLAAWMYRQKDTQQGDQDRPLLAGDGTVIMPTTLPQDVEQLLRPYVSLL